MWGWETIAFVCLGGMIACIYLRQCPQDIQADPSVALSRIRLHWSTVGGFRLVFEVGFILATLAAVATDADLVLWRSSGHVPLLTGLVIVAAAIFVADKIRQRRFTARAAHDLDKQESQIDQSAFVVTFAAMMVIMLATAVAVILAPTPQLRTAIMAVALPIWWFLVNYLAYWHIFRKPSASEKFPAVAALIERSGVGEPWIGWSPGPMFNAVALSKNRILLMGPMSSMAEDEINSIVAHELSHLRHDDIPRYVAWSRLSHLFGWLGFFVVLVWAGPMTTIADLLLALLATRVGLLLAAFISAPKKKSIEFRADREAAELTSPEIFATALTKLHLRSGVTDRWLPWEETFISHPSLEARLARLR